MSEEEGAVIEKAASAVRDKGELAIALTGSPTINDLGQVLASTGKLLNAIDRNMNGKQLLDWEVVAFYRRGETFRVSVRAIPRRKRKRKAPALKGEK